MVVKETKTITIELDDGDIKEAILHLLLSRGFKDIKKEDVELHPDKGVHASLALTETIDKTKKERDI